MNFRDQVNKIATESRGLLDIDQYNSILACIKDLASRGKFGITVYVKKEQLDLTISKLRAEGFVVTKSEGDNVVREIHISWE